MNSLRFISGKCILLRLFMYGCLFIHVPYAQADEFGRLFTTPEERTYLQILRYSKPENKVAVKEPDEEIVMFNADKITLNGIVYRKTGKSTAWLNGSNNYDGSLTTEYFRLNNDAISNKAVSVTIPKTDLDPDLDLDLKVGQTYILSNGNLLDIDEAKEPLDSKLP